MFKKFLFLLVRLSLVAVSSISAQTPVPKELPEAPQNLEVLPVGVENWLLRWEDRASNEQGFRIEQNDSSWTLVAEVGPNTQMLLVPGDTTMSSPQFRVSAFNEVGNSVVAGPASATPGEPMNVIFLLADDMGYKDIVGLREEGTDGPTIHETPALDRLIDQSVTFTNAFASGPRCVVARRSLQTGMYDFRPEAIGNGGGIDPSEITIGEAMKAGGYRTCFIGKWHLGSQAEGKAPEDQGYDVSIAAGEFGAPNNSYFPDPATLSYNLPNLGPAVSTDEYLTDRLTQEARGFIVDHVSNHSGQPFFMILSHYAVHTPLEAKPSDIDYFQAKRAVTDFSTHPQSGPIQEDYTADVRVWQDNVVYAAMMRSYDDSLAGLREELANQGIEDNTIIVVSSDHGGKSTFDTDKSNPASDFPTSNYPYRLGKTWCYDGGLRIPLIVHWPGVTTKAQEADTFVHGADFYKTFLDMSGSPEVPSQHIDSESFFPAVVSPASVTRTISPHYFTGISDGTGSTTLGAYRKGRYKMVYHLHRRFAELFDIHTDPGEQTDLYSQFPTLGNEMLSDFLQIRKETGARLPSPSNGHWAVEVSNLESYMTIPLPPEGAPGDLTLTPVAGSAIDLSWTDNSTNETRFIVFRKGPGESSFNEHKVLPADSTEWRDTGLTPTSTYEYRITAHNMGGWRSSGNQSASTLGSDIKLPLNPTDDIVRVRSGEVRKIPVLLNDEGESLSLFSVVSSDLAAISIDGNYILYDPLPGMTGTENIVCTIVDGDGNQATSTVQITVEPEPALTGWGQHELLPGSVGQVTPGTARNLMDGTLVWHAGSGTGINPGGDNLPLQAQYRKDNYTFAITIGTVAQSGESGIHLRENLGALSRGLWATVDADGTVHVRVRAEGGSPEISNHWTWGGSGSYLPVSLFLKREGASIQVWASNDRKNKTQLANITLPGLVGHFIGLTQFNLTEAGFSELESPVFRSAVDFGNSSIRLPNANAGDLYEVDLVDYLASTGLIPLHFTGLTVPSWASISADGLLNGTPGPADLGTNSVSVSVSDAEGAVSFTNLDVAVQSISAGVAEDFLVLEDTFSNASKPDDNFGSRSSLQVRDPANSFGRITYLKFVVDGIDGAPDTSQLHLYVEEFGDYSGSFQIYAVPDNSWSESSLTWTNQPVLGTQIGEYPAKANTWLVVDVSSYVTGNGTYSFAVTEETNNRADLSGKGSVNAPFLRLATGPLNNAPVMESSPPSAVTVETGEAWSAEFGQYFSDPDGDNLIFNVSSGPDWIFVSSDGFLSGTPESSETGTDNLLLRVEDTFGKFVEVNVELTVEESQLDSWFAVNTPDGLDRLPQADPDRDGRLNFVEFWEDTDPQQFDFPIHPVSVSVSAGSNGFDVDFRHQVRSNTNRIGLRFFESKNLSTWTEIHPTTVSTESIDSRLSWSTERISIGPNENIFLRRRLEWLD